MSNNYYYSNWLDKRAKSIDPIGERVGDFTVIPSLKIYYDEYPYKVVLHGNVIKHDIKAYSKWYVELQQMTWDYREQWTQKNTNWFFKQKDVVTSLVKHNPAIVKEVHGPVSVEHVDSIVGLDVSTTFRSSLWYGKYDTKITFNMPGSTKSMARQEVINYKKELTEYINSSYNDAKWYVGNNHGTWWCNYLYCTSKENREIIPFLKLSYSDIIDEVTVCKVIK